MWIDFHTHTKMSKKLEFSMDYFHKMIRSARRNGLDALALTEHFNTLHYSRIYETLDRHYPYKHDYYDVDGFKVFTGMEIDIIETGHILLIGNKAQIRVIHDKFADRLEKPRFPTFDEVLDTADSFAVLKIGAHPT
ncbi:PHP domain-containing protein, partial [Paenibacillus sepulcri]|nr:PHP domain-containing protein [Paenibacillus sepulcri]